MTKNNFFILTGAMGAGKSTVLNKIREQGYFCIEEPAREILKEQRKIMIFTKLFGKTMFDSAL